MNPAENPYSPGAGTRPPELAGRDQEIEDFRVLLSRVAAGRFARSMLITGLRGVGKTVLLVEFEQLAAAAKWFPAFKEVPSEKGDHFRRTITDLSRRVLLTMSAEERFKTAAGQALRVLKSFGRRARLKDLSGMEWSIGIDPIQGKADSGTLSDDLADVFLELGQVAKGHKTGVIFLFDEVQNLPETELSALIVAIHRVSQMNLPVTVLAAGLPQLPRLAAEAKSYSERLFKFAKIDALKTSDARAALQVPAKRQNVDFHPDALSRILQQSEGYPYFIQEWGEKVWNIAPGPTISVVDVDKAGSAVQQALDQGFFAVRADRATPSERRFMQAMAHLGDGAYKSAEVLKVLGGKAHQEVGMPRDRLIKKGLIYSPHYAELDFTVPQFANFMRRKYPGFRPARKATAKARAKTETTQASQ
jgi:AAA ATPase-like protein